VVGEPQAELAVDASHVSGFGALQVVGDVCALFDHGLDLLAGEGSRRRSPVQLGLGGQPLGFGFGDPFAGGNPVVDRGVPATKDHASATRTPRPWVDGVSEVIQLLRRQPMRIGRLHERMQADGYRWSTLGQVRYRLRWLEEVGAVTRFGTVRPEYRLKSLK
jgi:hypothetical protein